MTSKAEVVSPPAQPKTPFFAPPQDVACCALKTVGGPPFKKKAVSTCCTALKAQHEPHWPWFFTGVSAPSTARQSTRSAASKETPRFRAAAVSLFVSAARGARM